MKMYNVVAAATLAAVLSTTALAGPVTTGIATQFDGISLRQAIANGAGGVPPDMAGGVSATRVFQGVNGGFATYDRAGTQLSYKTEKQLLTDSGVSVADIDFTSDPRITYDPATKRFFAAIIGISTEKAATSAASAARLAAGSTTLPRVSGDPGGRHDADEGDGDAPGDLLGNNVFYLLVSKTSDPLDGFKAVRYTKTDGLFGDFPTLGVSRNAVTLTSNDFAPTGGFAAVSVFTVPKGDLLKSTPSLANLAKIETLDPNQLGFAIQPVNNGRSFTGAFGVESQKLVGISNVNFKVNASDLAFDAKGGIVAGVVEGAVPIAFDGETRGNRQPIDVAALRASDPLNRPHPLLDGGGDRISANIYQAGNYIFFSHAYGDSQTATPSTHNSVAWSILDARTNAIVSEGTVTDPNIDFTHVSIAPSRYGTKFVLAYTGSGPNQILSAFANICSFNAAAGTSQCGNRILVKEGLDPGYIYTGNGTRNRWGDYSAVQYDESKGTFWLFEEYPGLRNDLSPFYSPNSGRWNTVITELNVGAVPEPGMIALFGLGAGGLLLRRRRAA